MDDLAGKGADIRGQTDETNELPDASILDRLRNLESVSPLSPELVLWSGGGSI